MEIFREIAPLRAHLTVVIKAGKSIGFVPTMGALHAGHLALVRTARQQNTCTVVSIFVNPTQFNNADDLHHYPRTEAQDIELLRNSGCDVLFMPPISEMYAATPKLRIEVGAWGGMLEGQFRPGHFSGVALVVAKLFNLVQPHRSYFGQKDFQQFKVIDALVSELAFPIELTCVATVREPDGLAMSSRNKRLDGAQREAATVFYRALQTARAAIVAGKAWPEARADAVALISAQPLLRLEYLELVQRSNLLPADGVVNRNELILLIAGYAGEVRLIDNLFVE
jgi:pantoate--beta-alanine ligase